MNICVNDLNMCIFLHATPTKTDKDGCCPIKVQLDCNGERMQFTVQKLRANPQLWDTRTQRLLPFAPNSAYTNALLDKLQEQFNRIRLQAEIQNERLTIAQVKDRLQGYTKPRPDILGMIDKYLAHQKIRDEVGKITTGTYEGYVAQASVWRRFLKQEGINEVRNITKSTQDALGLYVLRNSKGTKGKIARNNYACMMIKSFRRFLNYCLDNEWIERNPFTRSADWKLEKPEKIYLTAEEVGTLQMLELHAKPKLEKARDCFLFSCFTGLGYSDLAKVKKKDLHEVENDTYLLVERKKTGTRGYVPLLPEAQELLEKYAYVLPLAEFNAYRYQLKELKKLAGLKKHISSHTGRKTFANRMLNEYNLPLETVSAMLCHADTQTTQAYYAEVTLKKIRTNTKHLFLSHSTKQLLKAI